MTLEQELSEAMGEHVADVRASSLMGTRIRRRHRGRRVRVRTAGAALVTVAVAGAVPSYLALTEGPRATVAGPAGTESEARAGIAPPVEVPRAIKMTVAEARAVLEAAGLTASVEGETGEAGLVVEQTPEIGESVPRGSAVRLVAIDPARPGPSSTADGPEEKTTMPQDLGDLGDGRAFGGVRFGYLPDGLEWGKWSGKNGFGTTSYTTTWQRPGLPEGEYDVQAVVYRDGAVAQLKKRMRGYERQGAEPITIDGRTAYLVRAGEAASRIDENGTLTLVWTENRDVAVEVMMSPGYAGGFGDRAEAEMRKIAEGVEAAK
ncbi:PASTA domain-containing protein [Streptosporangium sp. NPDC050855]|uniref:PASTA domain-containing protein n=1 Tax=Streptosporangium sp. NPDC050855 TaxID=3366194 RepID=UPI0037AA90ED